MANTTGSGNTAPAFGGVRPLTGGISAPWRFAWALSATIMLAMPTRNAWRWTLFDSIQSLPSTAMRGSVWLASAHATPRAVCPQEPP